MQTIFFQPSIGVPDFAQLLLVKVKLGPTRRGRGLLIRKLALYKFLLPKYAATLLLFTAHVDPAGKVQPCWSH